MTKVELVKGTVFEIDPKKNYLICIDRSVMSIDDIHILMRKLKISNGSVAIMTNGDPTTAVKIVESKEQ